MALKDKKKKKRPRPRRLGTRPFVPVFKTGMNRDIPLGGAGGSQNLIANLLASRQAQPSAQVIQTPDQFKLAQDIKDIKAEQVGIAEEAAILKKARSDKGTTGVRKVYNTAARRNALTAEQADAAAKEMLKTTSNLNRQAGAAPKQAEVAAAAAGVAEQAHQEAGNKVPAEIAGATLRIVPKAMGGKKEGRRDTLPDAAEIPSFDLRTPEGKAAYEDYKQQNPIK